MSAGFFSKWLKVSLVALVGAGFLAIVVYAFWMKDEIKSASVEPPLISAPDLPVKHRPDEPGGMNIPNRDKVVFDLLDASPTNSVSGVVAPVADVAVVPQVAPRVEASAPSSSIVSSEAPVSRGVSELKVVSPAPVAQMVSPIAKVSSVSSSSPQKLPVVSQKSSEEMPSSKKALTKVDTKSEPTLADKKDSVVGKKWGVQLAAVSTKADAEKVALSLKAKNVALKSLSSKVSQAGPSKFRVQFWGLKDKSAAVSLCAKITPCFPVAP